MQHVQEFTDHLNSIDNGIKFTNELEKNNVLAFLDTLTVREPGGNLKVKVYRKPTHGPVLEFQIQPTIRTQALRCTHIKS